ncbi:MAG: hypothetical protein ABJN65_01235 [Parasphingorhabdus sp.]
MHTVFSQGVKSSLFSFAVLAYAASCQPVDTNKVEVCFVDQENYTKIFIRKDWISARFDNDEYSGSKRFERCEHNGQICLEGLVTINFERSSKPGKREIGGFVSTNGEFFKFSVDTADNIKRFYSETQNGAPKLTYRRCEGESGKLMLANAIKIYDKLDLP